MRVNYHAVEADLLIATGVVRPHLYAGYTGGSRPIAVGCAGAGTLHDLHGPRFLDDPTVCAGNVSDNMHQNALREIAHRAGLQFVVNVVVNPDGEVVAVAAGAPNAVHNRLVEFARDVYEVPVPRESYNVVVTSPSSGLSRDLYRVSCDAAYVTQQREPVLAKGGVVMLPIGSDNASRRDAERRRFYDALSGATGMDTLLHQLRQRGLEPGQQYAYTLAQSVVDRNYRVIVAGPGSTQVAGGNGLITARDIAEAAALAETFVGSRAYALILPRGRWLMPTYKGVQWFDDRAYAEIQAGASWLDDTVVKSLFPEPGNITES